MQNPLHFPNTDERGVYKRLSRQTLDTIRYRLRKGPGYVRIESDGDLSFEQVADAVWSDGFQPLAIMLSPQPVAGIEGSVDGVKFRVFCSELGGNDALVLSMTVKGNLREVWDELFLPLIPVYTG